MSWLGREIEMDRRKRLRQARLHQAKQRGSRRSYKTELENAQLLLAWEAARLSEGQMAAALGVDLLAVRKMRDAAIAEGMRLAEALQPSNA
jgi:hypothetical protein